MVHETEGGRSRSERVGQGKTIVGGDDSHHGTSGRRRARRENSLKAVIRSVKRVCYAGLDSVTLRREVAARAAPVLAFDAHAFGTTDPDTGLLTHVLAEGVPDSMVNQYVELLYPHECARI